MISIVTLLLSLLVIFAVLSPIFAGQAAQHSEAETAPLAQELTDKMQRFTQLLQDLELDHLTGKISKNEFDRMRLRIEKDLNISMQELDRLGASQ